MSDIVVSISDLKVSMKVNDVLVTYAPGSCIGVTVYDPIAKVGGLLHYMLPESAIDENKAEGNPEMFADTGIPLRFRICYSLGAEKKKIVAKVAGGASILNDANYFRIGQKNITALRHIFWKNNIMIDAEDIGRNCNRTMRLDVNTGAVYIRTSGGAWRN
jgi:chemotaxis protein CheD